MELFNGFDSNYRYILVAARRARQLQSGHTNRDLGQGTKRAKVMVLPPAGTHPVRKTKYSLFMRAVLVMTMPVYPPEVVRGPMMPL